MSGFYPQSSGGGGGASSFGKYVTDILSLSPFLYWQCQETSGALQDSSGNGRNGAASGTAATYRITGPQNSIGNAPFGIQMGDATTLFQGGVPALNQTAGGWFIECWLNLPTNVAAQQIWTSSVDGLNNPITLQTVAATTFNAWNTILQGIGTNGTALSTLNSGWHQVVVGRPNGPGTNLYRYWFDGIPDTIGVTSNSSGASTVGNFAISGAAGWRIAHVSIFTNHFCTNGEVLKRYNDMLFGT